MTTEAARDMISSEYDWELSAGLHVPNYINEPVLLEQEP